MQSQEVIKILENQGVRVRLSPEGKLLASTLHGDLTASQIALLKGCKEGIIAILKGSIEWKITEWQRRGIRFYTDSRGVQIEYGGQWADFQSSEIAALDDLIYEHGQEVLEAIAGR
jgi:hypothetical protein